MKYPIPFDHALFPLVAVFRAPAERGPSSKVASIATNYGGALKLAPRRYAAARELRVRTPDDAKKSDSFQNERPDGNPGADASHFHFLPGIDDVEIRWKVDRPLLASKTRFELWCATDGTAPVWSSDHEGAPTSGQEEGSIACSEIRIASDDRFPDRCPNAAHAPYQLRMVVTDRETGCVSTAWTYFDVVVDSIQLHWGAQALVPPGDIADVLPIYNALTDRDEKALVTALGQTTTRVPDTGTIEVLLKSTNAAYVNVDEWYSWRDFCFLRFKGRWGDGPRIPVIAKVFMKGLAGPVHSADAAKALGPARFLWDWCDRSETDRRAALAGVDSTTKAFVMKGLKYKENAVGEPPACLNAHADRGGKRGGASRVLPEWSDRAKFPFTVAAATTRSWAVFSTARTDGAQACCSGVVFQPCRMGGDTYKLRVFLATGRFAAALDVTDPMTRLVSDHDGLPGAESAMVEVLRQVDARYIRKGTSTPRMDLGAITTAYACGG
ncbi:MAG TPA: hypothetical protein VIF15_16030, partial [Polyangiaceae bacterium]